MLELELGLEGMEVSFSVCCWVIVVFFWALYALAACYLMSWSSTLVDGSGSGTRTSTEKSEQLSKEVFLVIKKEEHEQELGLELELEHKEQDCKEHEEQQEFSGNVDVEAGEGLREIGQEMDGAQLQHQKDQQQQSVVKVPSQDVKGAKGDVGHEGHHLQQYGRVNKQERGHLLTTAGFLNMDKAECELVRTEETAENAGFLATGGVATKAEGEDQSRAQSNELTGNDQDIFPFVEKQPSFAETHHRYQLPRAPQRTDYMSQSMPDLHAVKRTGAIESTLARWSRMTLDPERLGSIFQYYLRQRASTLKKERQTDEGEQYSTATSDYNFQGGNNNDDVDDVDDFEESEEGPGVTFVIRSSTLPTVRVGLYGADQKRLWTSSGSVHLTPLPEDDEGVPAVSAGHE
ncbi:hypothetical protein EC991_003994 [Linnemannia zychae]|nr:hypothetical protein EC991_003994 [Linnemannia zychae]